MTLSFINIHKVPREMLKTSGFALGFQHLPQDLANVNEWKIMFDPYIACQFNVREHSKHRKKTETRGPWVNSYKSFIQHLRLSVAMATNQNEEFVQHFYAWWRTTKETFLKMFC